MLKFFNCLLFCVEVLAEVRRILEVAKVCWSVSRLSKFYLDTTGWTSHPVSKHQCSGPGATGWAGITQDIHNVPHPLLLLYIKDKLTQNAFLILIVGYHEDRCTKNKHMIRIPMRGLFLTRTENSFYSAHTCITLRIHIYLKGKIVLLGKAIPCA